MVPFTQHVDHCIVRDCAQARSTGLMQNPCLLQRIHRGSWQCDDYPFMQVPATGSRKGHPGKATTVAESASYACLISRGHRPNLRWRVYLEFSRLQPRQRRRATALHGCHLHCEVGDSGLTFRPAMAEAAQDQAARLLRPPFLIFSTCPRWFRSWPANMRTMWATVSLPRS